MSGEEWAPNTMVRGAKRMTVLDVRAEALHVRFSVFQWPQNLPKHSSYFVTCTLVFLHCGATHSGSALLGLTDIAM